MSPIATPPHPAADGWVTIEVPVLPGVEKRFFRLGIGLHRVHEESCLSEDRPISPFRVIDADVAGCDDGYTRKSESASGGALRFALRR